MVNLIVTRGQDFGWTSPLTLGLIGGALAAIVIFFAVEHKKKNQFIEFSLFKSKPYTGAVVSNFLQNGIVATAVVANTYLQLARGFTPFQTGLLTIGNVIALLVMIRVGEKMLQKMGARKPNDLGDLYRFARHEYDSHDVFTRCYLFHYRICRLFNFRDWPWNVCDSINRYSCHQYC